jgi:hypothetical protein
MLGATLLYHLKFSLNQITIINFTTFVLVLNILAPFSWFYFKLKLFLAGIYTENGVLFAIMKKVFF